MDIGNKEMPDIPLHDKAGIIWMDGNTVPTEAAQIHILTHSLHYATCVFEGIRVYDGNPFALKEHFKRLHESARQLNYSLLYSVDELCSAALDLLKSNNISDGYIRPISWLGSESLGLQADGLSIHTAIAVWDWPQVYALNSAASGISVHLSDIRRPSPKSIPPQAKASASYLVGSLAYHSARRNNCQDSLLLDEKGFLAEGSSANVFLVFDNSLHTPIADRCLNGITRQLVIQIARSLGVKVIERRIAVKEIINAEEIFLTGTAVEVLPVSRVDQHAIPIGPVSKNLQEAYGKLARENKPALNLTLFSSCY